MYKIFHGNGVFQKLRKDTAFFAYICVKIDAFRLFDEKKLQYYRFFLHMSKKSSTFAPGFENDAFGVPNASRGGGIGRHEGLKILWPVMAVRVQVPPAVHVTC